MMHLYDLAWNLLLQCNVHFLDLEARYNLVFRSWSRGPHGAIVRYWNDYIGIQVSLELREPDVRTSLVRLAGGHEGFPQYIDFPDAWLSLHHLIRTRAPMFPIQYSASDGTTSFTLDDLSNIAHSHAQALLINAPDLLQGDFTDWHALQQNSRGV